MSVPIAVHGIQRGNSCESRLGACGWASPTILGGLWSFLPLVTTRLSIGTESS